MRTTIRRFLSVLAVLVALPLVGHANEGFWPFNRIPKAAIKQALGVDLSAQWIEFVQQASVRFPGGSGSFVSPDGLVRTNHHVSPDLLHKISTPEQDLASKGFVAADRAVEIKATDLELLSMRRIDNVTSRGNEAVTPGMSSAETLVFAPASSTRRTGWRTNSPATAPQDSRPLVERMNHFATSHIGARPTLPGRSYGTAPLQIVRTHH